MDTIRQRQEEATSDETLEELEDERVLEQDDAEETGGPSPDGAFDGEDDLKNADPI